MINNNKDAAINKIEIWILFIQINGIEYYNDKYELTTNSKRKWKNAKMLN